MRYFGVFLSIIPQAVAWGVDGHKIVAEIANHFLSDLARAEIKKILPRDSIVSVATWADEVDHTPAYAWSKCMHYVDSGEGICSVDPGADCGGPSGCCVINAIANYTQRVSDSKLHPADREEAMKFLVHLVGDSTQPLHAGSRSNHGGNGIHVYANFGNHVHNPSDEHSETNLHSVWDSVMIEESLRESRIDFAEYSKNLISKLQQDKFLKGCEQVIQDPFSCPAESANESAELACTFAYVNVDGSTIESGQHLGRDYYLSRLSEVEERLSAGGVRLAAILNQVFATPNHIADVLLPEFEVL